MRATLLAQLSILLFLQLQTHVSAEELCGKAGDFDFFIFVLSFSRNQSTCDSVGADHLILHSLRPSYWTTQPAPGCQLPGPQFCGAVDNDTNGGAQIGSAGDPGRVSQNLSKEFEGRWAFSAPVYSLGFAEQVWKQYGACIWPEVHRPNATNFTEGLQRTYFSTMFSLSEAQTTPAFIKNAAKTGDPVSYTALRSEFGSRVVYTCHEDQGKQYLSEVRFSYTKGLDGLPGFQIHYPAGKALPFECRAANPIYMDQPCLDTQLANLEDEVSRLEAEISEMISAQEQNQEFVYIACFAVAACLLCAGLAIFTILHWTHTGRDYSPMKLLFPWHITLMRRKQKGIPIKVTPDPFPEDREELETQEVKPEDFEDYPGVPLKSMLAWLKEHDYYGFKGGIARAVAKMTFGLDQNIHWLSAELEKFNDIDIAIFGGVHSLAEKQDVMADICSQPLAGIKVVAGDIEVADYDIVHYFQTRDLTINQVLVICIKGKLWLINTAVARAHSVQGHASPVRACSSCLLHMAFELDAHGHPIAGSKHVARAFVAWCKGRANDVLLDKHTLRHYQKELLSPGWVFYIMDRVPDSKFHEVYLKLVSMGITHKMPGGYISWWHHILTSLIDTATRHGGCFTMNQAELLPHEVLNWKHSKMTQVAAKLTRSIDEAFYHGNKTIDAAWVMEYTLPDNPDLAPAKNIRTKGRPPDNSSPDSSPKRRKREKSEPNSPSSSSPARSRRSGADSDSSPARSVGRSSTGQASANTEKSIGAMTMAMERLTRFERDAMEDAGGAGKYLAQVKLKDLRAVTKSRRELLESVIKGPEANGDDAAGEDSGGADGTPDAPAAEAPADKGPDAAGPDAAEGAIVPSADGGAGEGKDEKKKAEPPFTKKKANVFKLFRFVLRPLNCVHKLGLLVGIAIMAAAAMLRPAAYVVDSQPFAVAAAGAVSVLLAFVGEMIVLAMVRHAMYCLNHNLMMKLLELDTLRLTPMHFADIWARLAGDSKVLTSIMTIVWGAVVQLLTGGAAAGMLIMTANAESDADVGLACMIFVGVNFGAAFLVAVIFGIVTRILSRRARTATATVFMTTFQILRNLRCLQQTPADLIHRSYEDNVYTMLTQRLRVDVVSAAGTRFLVVVQFVSMAIFLPQVAKAKEFLTIVVLMPVASFSICAFGAECVRFGSLAGSLERFLLLFEEADKLQLAFGKQEAEPMKPLQDLTDEDAVALKIEGLSFTYEAVAGAAKPMLEVKDGFSAKSGEISVLEVPRGGGTTTLLRILYGQAPAPEGIELHGRNLSEYSGQALRKMIVSVDYRETASVFDGFGDLYSVLDHIISFSEDEIDSAVIVATLKELGLLHKLKHLRDSCECDNWCTLLGKQDAYLVDLARVVVQCICDQYNLAIFIDPLRLCRSQDDADHLGATLRKQMKRIADRGTAVVVVNQTPTFGDMWNS